MGRHRGMPLDTPAPQDNAAQNTPNNNDIQQGTAAQSNLQEPTPAQIEDHTISVEQVREHFKSKGLRKSKDTVQRWCRTGELDCQKRGVLGRYFTTETSLFALEQKLLPDMIAESEGGLSAASSSTQPHATAQRTDVPQHTDASAC